VDGLALRIALERLRGHHRRASQVLEMHGIFGMKLNEVAAKLAVSTRTVRRDWQSAQDWLVSELGRSRRPRPTRRSARNGNNEADRIAQHANVKAAAATGCLAEVA
jgi:uncharacterized protein YjcR